MTAADLLPAEWAAFIREAVASGRFANEVDVLAAGLAELKARQVAFSSLQAHVAQGVGEAERGEFAAYFSIAGLIEKTRGM